MVPARKASYRASMFESSTLTSLEAVEDTVSEFSEIVNETNIRRMLDDVILNESTAVLRLVLSCLDEALIMGLFPLAPEAFSGSQAHKILSQLSEFFLIAHRVPSLHTKHHQLVKDAPGILAAIAAKLLGTGPDQTTSTSGGKKSKGTSQKTMKLARRVAAQDKNALNAEPFERLDIPVPETPEELEKAIEIILVTQRSILKAYLESLRLPDVGASVKAVLVSAKPEFPFESEEAPDSRESDEESDPRSPEMNAESPLAATDFPFHKPLKFSTLYRKRAKGFGEWEINIAPRAERNLREYNRRDRKVFVLIVNKMRALSNGDFSLDNHVQVNVANVEIPIYQAKVTEELRVVYQIDCVPIHDDKGEEQALRVFGVYEHAQLSRGSFWDSMSRELGKRGSAYKDRCTRRQKASGTDGTIFVPVKYSEQEDVRLSTGSVPDLPSDDAEQIQSLLLKTVHFSQPLLESIIADLDVAFVLKISPKELDVIEYPHSCYVLGRSGTGKTTTMLYKMLLVEASDVASTPETRKTRQLFVTQSRILADKVGEHFSKLLGGYRPSAMSENLKAAAKADRALFVEEDNDWRSDLPKKYSDLQDTDFPLFVSFDQLCTMLERDMESSGSHVAKSTRLTYPRFKSEYFSHFPLALRKGFEPSMVFSEFLGVIMGSEQALAHEFFHLDRETYLNLGERGQSTFVGQREQIYDLYEKYVSQKRRQNDHDAADRTHAILKFFQNYGLDTGRKIDYLYVDEAQDNLLIDSLLLRSLCQNPAGLFWAGDTAQTINVGSSFRFNELKAFLHRIEKQRQNKHPELSFRPVAPPRTFQLTVNYRSHAGIVNCAHSVIEVITRLWPHAIDLLDRERGTVDGLRPIFFTSWDSVENMQSKQFLFGDSQSSGGYIELGAQQCILVRNDTAKENLRKEVGDIGLILTLYESKGLEFNDVLLYNFFEDSTVAESQWRVVLNVMDRIRDAPPAPNLDRIRHASVCTELKFLYVAITRARNNIWIADCSTKGEPMRLLWTSKDQIQNCRLGTDTPRFAISSTPAEWEEQGRKLFDRQRFSQAKLCFERAYMPHEAAVARAYHLREQANEMPNGLRREITARKVAFLEVATAFMDCAKHGRGDAVKTYFRRAGESFEDAGDITKAISAYTEARCFNRVAELHRIAGEFDDAVATVQKHRHGIDVEVFERVINVARLFYFKKKQIDKAVRLFDDNHEKALGYLEDRGLHAERATVLESLEKFSEAAEIHLEEGRTSEAVALFLRDHKADRAIDCVLQGLWEIISFAVFPDIQDTSLSRLLSLASQAELSSVSKKNSDEISVLLAIANREISKLQKLGQSFFERHNSALTLLCLDHYFQNHPRIQALQTNALAEHLQLFHVYVKLLYHFAFNFEPCNSLEAEKLFGFRREGENNYLIRQGTFLHHALAPSNSSSDGKFLLTGSNFRAIFRQSLRDRLAKRVREENAMCRVAKAFQGPCPIFAIFTDCSCPLQHIPPGRLDSRQYRLRVRIHLQQILIYHSLHNIEADDSERRYWISRLYAELNPPSYQLGSAHNLDFRLIPEAEAALQIVKEWVKSSIYTVEFAPETDFLTRTVQLALMAFQFDAKHAMSYLTRAPFMVDPRKPLKYQRPPQGHYIVADFFSALEDKETWGLSAGIVFLQRIITSRLLIQVNVLCDVAEYLCAGLIVADCQKSGPLHGITLPRSWLVKRATTPGGLRSDQDTNYFWVFAESLVELLKPVCSGVGADHLLCENKNLGDPTLDYMISNIFLARIFRCLCLLAYNFRNDWLRDYVFTSITSLRRRDFIPRLTFLCSKYVHANSWTGLTWVVRSSTADGSALDEMVQLLHPLRGPPRAMPDVRQILYKNIEDIPRLLGSSPSATTNPARVQAEIKEEGGNVYDDGEASTDRRLPEDVDIDVPAIPELVARSEEELAAAAKIRKAILRAHRRAVQRKRGTGKASLAAQLAEFFTECRDESVAMDRPDHLYRIYFLGPLPHLLLSLDIVGTRAQKEKKQALKEYGSAEHQGLEDVDRKLTAVRRTLNSVIEIQKALKPTAEIHVRRNVNELKRRAEEAISLLEDLPFTAPPGLREHLGVASKAFVQTWTTVTRRAKPKPSLNTEEEMY